MATYERELRRGAFFNTLGLVARLLEPLFVLFATWLYGPVVLAHYLIAIFMVEISAGFLAAGYADAATIFASKDVDQAATDRDAADRVAQVLANAFVATFVLSVSVAIATQLGAATLVEVAFPDHREMVPGLHLVGWSLVPFSFAAVAIAATKARLRMEYDALVGGLRPVVLIATAVVARSLDASVTGLFAAWLVTQIVVAVLSLWPLFRLYDARAIVRAIGHLRPHRAMLTFAVPQSLNLTLNRYITRLDVLMLAAMGFGSVQVAWYGTAAILTSNLKTIRTVWSGALAPVAARHHQAGERDVLTRLLNQLSNVTTTIIVPIVLAAVVLRDDILGLANEAYRGDSAFVAMLLVPPFMNCAYGLAGNTLMFTGHSGWTLTNSLSVALLNTLLNWLLIPPFGLLGAAVATAIAVGLVSAAQVVELRLVEGVALRWRDVLAPHLGLLAGLVVVALSWDPAAIGGLGQRIALAGALVVLSLGICVALDRPLRASMARIATGVAARVRGRPH